MNPAKVQIQTLRRLARLCEIRRTAVGRKLDERLIPHVQWRGSSMSANLFTVVGHCRSNIPAGGERQHANGGAGGGRP